MPLASVVFCCRRCGVELSDFLREVSLAELTFETGVDVVAPGSAWLVDTTWEYYDFLAGVVRPRREPEQVAVPDVAFLPGDHLVNPDDIRHRMLPDAQHGCCGWQPRAEANVGCPSCKLPIGSLHSDECWSPTVLRLIGEQVEPVRVVDA